MATIKKFNQMNENNSYDGITLKEFFGDIIDNKNSISLTDKGIYTDYEKGDIDRWGNRPIKLQETHIKGIYDVLIKRFEDSMNFTEYGYLLFKDNKPYILSSIPGDHRGAVTFNNIFISSGHDGSLLFNIDNPFEFMRNTW